MDAASKHVRRPAPAMGWLPAGPARPGTAAGSWRALALLALILAFCPVGSAHAFAYIMDSDGANPFLGRRLWDPNLLVADPLDPTKQIMKLGYAFAPPVGAAQFSLTLPGGAVLRAPINNTPFTNNQRAAINRAVVEWDSQAQHPFAGNQNDNLIGIKGAGIDLQSVALHELGHVLGLGHPNPLRQNSNVNVKNAAGTPDFTLEVGASKDNLGFNKTAIQQYAGARPVPAGVKKTEAAMVQGIVQDEVQWKLATDDVQGLTALQTGQDTMAGTADDYRFLFTERSFFEAKRISFFNVDAAFFNVFGGAEALGVPGPDPLTNPGNYRFAKIFFDLFLPPDGSDPFPVSMTELFFTSDPNSPGADIAYANVFLLQDLDVNIPEPSSIALSGIALLCLATACRRRRTRNG